MIKEPIDAINFDCLPLLGFTTDVHVEGRERKEEPPSDDATTRIGCCNGPRPDPP